MNGQQCWLSDLKGQSNEKDLQADADMAEGSTAPLDQVGQSYRKEMS